MSAMGFVILIGPPTGVVFAGRSGAGSDRPVDPWATTSLGMLWGVGRLLSGLDVPGPCRDGCGGSPSRTLHCCEFGGRVSSCRVRHGGGSCRSVFNRLRGGRGWGIVSDTGRWPGRGTGGPLHGRARPVIRVPGLGL